MLGSCEHCNKFSGSIKRQEIPIATKQLLASLERLSIIELFYFVQLTL
jgi:hypothetical protein